MFFLPSFLTPFNELKLWGQKVVTYGRVTISVAESVVSVGLMVMVVWSFISKEDYRVELPEW
jgi:hypothetical protein